MKNLITFLTLGVLTVTSFAFLPERAEARINALAYNYFADDDGEARFPVPEDNDVIKTFGMATKVSLPATKFRFLVWNLHKGTEDRFTFDYVSLAFNRDIIMNQEIFLDDNMMRTFRFYPNYFFSTATSFFSGDDRVRTGVANISPVKPVFTKFIRTETREPVVNSPKVALVTSYPIAKTTRKLTVVNIHGINFVLAKSFRHEMERIYQTIKDIPSPLVFAGDFNTWNEDRLDILAEYAKKLGLKEATFSPDDRMRFNGKPLDHFLYTKDIKILSAKVEGRYEGSDHKPLEVEVEYVPQLKTKEADDLNQDRLASH